MNADLLSALKRGEAVLVSTDTVYGLGALPGTQGYEQIFALKGRPRQQALPWLVASRDALEHYGADISDYGRRLASMFWPGALTLVVKASKEALDWGVESTDSTIALRCPDSAELLSMLEQLEGPLACTSVNVHGEPAAQCRDDVPQVMLSLAGFDDLEETCDSSLASTIVDCTGPYPKILRDGPIPEQVVLDVAAFGATLTD